MHIFLEFIQVLCWVKRKPFQPNDFSPIAAANRLPSIFHSRTAICLASGSKQANQTGNNNTTGRLNNDGQWHHICKLSTIIGKLPHHHNLKHRVAQLKTHIASVYRVLIIITNPRENIIIIASIVISINSPFLNKFLLDSCTKSRENTNCNWLIVLVVANRLPKPKCHNHLLHFCATPMKRQLCRDSRWHANVPLLALVSLLGKICCICGFYNT